MLLSIFVYLFEMGTANLILRTLNKGSSMCIEVKYMKATVLTCNINRVFFVFFKCSLTLAISGTGKDKCPYCKCS